LHGWSKLRAAGHANEGLAAVKLICHTPVPLERSAKRIMERESST
jgi:hypothetical protein